jgi:hypothetical protein
LTGNETIADGKELFGDLTLQRPCASRNGYDGL